MKQTKSKEQRKLRLLYSKEIERIAFNELQRAEESGFVKINEYRNFFDYCIIPFIRIYLDKCKEIDEGK